MKQSTLLATAVKPLLLLPPPPLLLLLLSLLPTPTQLMLLVNVTVLDKGCEDLLQLDRPGLEGLHM